MFKKDNMNFSLIPYEYFVFDFAGVLFHCDYIKFVQQAFPNHANHQELVDKIFHSELFVEYDKNLIDTKELTVKLCELVSCQSVDIDNLILAIKEHMVPMQDTVLFLHELKKKNVKLYGLTNMPKEVFDHLMKTYEFLALFENTTASSELGIAKPDSKIYQHVLNKNNLDPSKTVFIDDRAVNLPPAEQLGINTFLFTTVDQLIDGLKARKTSARLDNVSQAIF